MSSDETSSKSPQKSPLAQGMKSAYELALERMDSQGIERPREDALSDDARARMVEIRSKAEARLAELEILHRDRLLKLPDPTARQQEEEDYRLERRSIESARDRDLEKVRSE